MRSSTQVNFTPVRKFQDEVKENDRRLKTYAPSIDLPKYKWVKLLTHYGYYTVCINEDVPWSEAAEWCEDNIPHNDWTHNDEDDFFFTYKDDAVMFKLKFG